VYSSHHYAVLYIKPLTIHNAFLTTPSLLQNRTRLPPIQIRSNDTSIMRVGVFIATGVVFGFELSCVEPMILGKVRRRRRRMAGMQAQIVPTLISIVDHIPVST
jgi:hypothetical protein